MPNYRQHHSLTVLKSPDYSKHVQAMTAEALHGKGEIAEELAARDIRIVELEAKRNELLKAIEKAHSDICRLRAEGSDLTIASIVAPDLRAAIAKVKP